MMDFTEEEWARLEKLSYWYFQEEKERELERWNIL